MRRLTAAGLLPCFALFGLAATAADQPDVDRAVQAMGGPALSQVRTIVVKGETRHLDPGQTVKAGGEYRLADNSTFTESRDLAAGKSRTEWYRKMLYPAPREYKFTEVIADGVGYVNGVDSTARVKQSLDTNQQTMSGSRVAASTREFVRSSPTLLAQMQQQPARVAKLPDQKIGQETFPAVRYQSGQNTFIVLFDRSSGLPARVRTLDYDSLQGDSTYDLVLSDWRQAGPIKYPYKQVYQLNGGNVIETAITDVTVNPALAADAFSIPPEMRVGAPKIATGDVPYQWVLRRQFIGVYLDSDAMTYDPKSGPGPHLVDLAPGISQMVGGTHNSLIVEMDTFLVSFDTPISEQLSKWTMEQAAKKYPGKPFKYVVLTHHHMDHTSGIRNYAAAGATVVVAKGNGQYFVKALSSPDALGRDAPKKPFKPEVVETDGRYVITDGKREVYAYLIENPHAEGMLIGYIPDAKLGFVADLWSPGRDALPAKPTPALMAVVAGVKKWGIEPTRFAGGHGSVGDYAPLAKLAATAAP